MYGFIYNTLKSLVVKLQGEEGWRAICEKAQVDAKFVDGFLDRTYYDEGILFSVCNAASQLLGIPTEDIFEEFGVHFFETIKASGHQNLLKALGHNLYGFLMNLDALHDHLTSTYKEMEAPSFRCEKPGKSGLILHYYSKREGLAAIVTGIVKTAAREFFNLDVDIKLQRHEEMSEGLRHHYVFNIEVRESTKRDECYLERLIGDHQEMEGIPTLITEELPLEYPSPGPLTLTNSCEGKRPSTGQMFSLPFEIQSITEQADVPPSPGPSSESSGLSSPTRPFADSPDLRHTLRHVLPSLSSLHRMPASALPPLSRMGSRRGSTALFFADSDWPITPQLFQTCFPFHIIFDRDLVIRHMGVSLYRLFPLAISSEAKLSKYFEMLRPAGKLNFENIRAAINNVFVLATKPSAMPASGRNRCAREALTFRGQMVPTSSIDGALILFLASPRIESIQDLESQGLYLSDIPIHDVTRDLILLNRHFQVERKIAKELEETKEELRIQKAQVEREKERADKLLHSMLPWTIALELKNGAKASATEYPMVTILFSDIKGFTTVCSRCQPMEVVGMLNRLYTRFDNLIEKHNVYKVETIGDAYMVAAGLLDTSEEHAEAVTNMAFDMRDEASKVMKPMSDEPLQIRIGIHSGPVVAGVVGMKMPRYCLFGDTVNTASRMESHGAPDYIHISEATYNYLRTRAYQFYSRGLIFIKGLGDRQTYFVEPADGDVGATMAFCPIDDYENGYDRENFIRSPSFVKTQIRRISTSTRNIGTVWPAPPLTGAPDTPAMMKRLTTKKSSGASVQDKSPSPLCNRSPSPLPNRSPSPLPDGTDGKVSAIYMVNIEPNGSEEDEASERASQGTASEEAGRTDPGAISRRKKSGRSSVKKKMEKCRVS